MYVVRSGRQWDNPRIEFIVHDEEIAKRIVSEDQHKRYKNHMKSLASMISIINDRMLFHKYKVNTKMAIDEHDKERYKQDKESHKLYSKEASLTFEEWLQEPSGRYADWFYEEYALIESLEDALGLYIEANPQHREA